MFQLTLETDSAEFICSVFLSILSMSPRDSSQKDQVVAALYTQNLCVQSSLRCQLDCGCVFLCLFYTFFFIRCAHFEFISHSVESVTLHFVFFETCYII